MDERIIDTVDGEVKAVKTYDPENNWAAYIEFYKKTGCDEEADPWEYEGESMDMPKDFDDFTDEELEEVYYEYC